MRRCARPKTIGAVSIFACVRSESVRSVDVVVARRAHRRKWHCTINGLNMCAGAWNVHDGTTPFRTHCAGTAEGGGGGGDAGMVRTHSHTYSADAAISTNSAREPHS